MTTTMMMVMGIIFMMVIMIMMALTTMMMMIMDTIMIKINAVHAHFAETTPISPYACNPMTNKKQLIYVTRS